MSAATSYLAARDRDDELPPAGSNHRRRRALLIAAAVVVLAVVATWVVAFSSVLGVRTVEVHGAHALTAAQVRAAAGIANGAPLVRLDTAAATRRVEQLPDVESAQIATSLPSTVVITIVERTPVGYVALDGTDRLVDSTGAQYRTVTTAPAHLPKFVVPAGASGRSTGRAVATVAAALPVTLLPRVASIEAMDPQSITLVLTGGRIVQWGSAARSADKARILPTLLKQDGTQFDVSDPDQPFSR